MSVFFLPLLLALRSARYLDASSLVSLYHWESGLVPPKPEHFNTNLKNYLNLFSSHFIHLFLLSRPTNLQYRNIIVAQVYM
jgi:hypothetical protein